VYSDEHGDPLAFAMFDNGYARRYRLEAKRVGEDQGAPVLYIAHDEQASPRPINAEARDAAALFAASKSERKTWAGLPDGSPVLAVRQLDDGAAGVLTDGTKASDPVVLHVVRDGAVTETVSGEEAFRRVSEADAKSARAASDGAVNFVHCWVDGDTCHLQAGEKRVDFPVRELRTLLADPTSAGKLKIDEVFLAEGAPKDFIVLRGAMDQRPERLGGSLRKGSPDEPLRVCTALRERYRTMEKQVHLDDDPAAAKPRLARIRPIAGKDDVALVMPEAGQFPDFHGSLKTVKEAWTSRGFKVYGDLSAPPPEHQLCVLTAHNNAQLLAYLEGLGKRGILKGRTWILLTCGEPGNANMFSDLLQRYGADGFPVFREKIHGATAIEMLRQLPDKIVEQLGSGERRTLWESIGDTVRDLLKRYPAGGKHERFRQLRDGMLQLSYLSGTGVRGDVG
jgi:hypothetical protein